MLGVETPVSQKDMSNKQAAVVIDLEHITKPIMAAHSALLASVGITDHSHVGMLESAELVPKELKPIIIKMHNIISSEYVNARKKIYEEFLK